MLDDPAVHGLGALVLHEPEVESDRRPVGDDRVGFLAHRPGAETADRERRAEHQALQVVRGEPHAQLALERGSIQRDPAEQLTLGGRGRPRVGGQALDERGPVRGGHRREQADQRPRRVRHAEVPRVDVPARRLQLEGEREDPARPEDDGRALRRVLRSVRHQDQVRRQEIAVGRDERPEAGAPHFLLTFEHELHVHAGGDAEGVHEREGLEVRPDRALVVGRPARVQPVAGQRVVTNLAGTHDGGPLLREAGAEHGLERRRLKPPRRRRGLRVEVTVDEEGSRGARRPSLAEDDRVATRLEHARLEPAALHRLGQPAGAGADALRVLAHRVDAEARDEAIEDLAPASLEGAVERRPVHGAGGSRRRYCRRARTTWAIRRMCSGVEPQQAPTTVAPASRRAGYSPAMASGASS